MNIVFGYVWKWDILPNGRFLGEKMMNQPMPCPRKHSLSEPEGYPIGPSHAWAIKSRSWMQFNPLMKGTGRQWGYCYCRAVVPLRLRLQVRQRCFSLIISSCSISSWGIAIIPTVEVTMVVQPGLLNPVCWRVLVLLQCSLRFVRELLHQSMPDWRWLERRC